MKALKYLFMAAITFAVSGCDLLEDAADVKFEVVVNVDWLSDENGEGNNVPYSNVELVDLSGNSEIQKYASKIKEIKVDKITYAIANYNDDPHGNPVVFTNGVASFFAVGSSTPVALAPYAASASGVNLKTTTSETELAIDAAALSEVAAVFKRDKQITMQTSGTLSQIPVQFTVVSKFYLTITAGALD